MPKKSAGLLLYRYAGKRQPRAVLEVFLVHPGGPFWAKKDDGAWSIPKGEIDDQEEALSAACREFREETGLALPAADFRPLRLIRQAGGKEVLAWAVEADFDAQTVRSNTFSLEWPPRSGKTREFPEVDRAAWFPLDMARLKILKSQLPLLDQLLALCTSKD